MSNFSKIQKKNDFIAYFSTKKADVKNQLLALIAGFMIFTPFSGSVLNDSIMAFKGSNGLHPPLSIGSTTLVAKTTIKIYSAPNIVKNKTFKRIITAYSSTPEETDSTPFITASGSYVRFGIIAANWLPIGTAVRIPEHFGKQVFIVEDRMNARHPEKVDVWLPTKEAAIKFGKRIAQVEVL